MIERLFFTLQLTRGGTEAELTFIAIMIHCLVNLMRI